jgi:hypothetical protein
VGVLSEFSQELEACMKEVKSDLVVKMASEDSAKVLISDTTVVGENNLIFVVSGCCVCALST